MTGRSKSAAWADGLLRLVFHNADIDGIARGAKMAGSLFVSLHSADPGDDGDQATFEITGPGYDRVEMARTKEAWSVGAGEATNEQEVDFGRCDDPASHFGIGIEGAGPGQLLYRGELTEPCGASGRTYRPSIPEGAMKIREA